MIVVSDTTPLISLLKTGRLDTLEKLFGEVRIPDAVFEELTSNPRYSDEASTIRSFPYIDIISVSDTDAVEQVSREDGLDLGESEAIVLTQEISADLLLMDEARGRDVARSLGLRITGTVGILLLSYERGILNKGEIMDCVERLRDANRFIGERYLQLLLERIQ
jgi:predicted nucleic acid-binding protein